MAVEFGHIPYLPFPLPSSDYLQLLESFFASALIR